MQTKGSLAAIKPRDTFAVRRTGFPEVKTIFQCHHFCSCAPCATRDYHHCLHQAFLGMTHLNQAAFLVQTFTIEFLISHLQLFLSFIGEWQEENMDINQVQENPKAVLRQEHAATIRLQLEEILGTFNEYFFDYIVLE